jgi:hypothetical protein
MTDDLMKRLRESGSRSEVELYEDREEAADRIDALEARLAEALNALTDLGETVPEKEDYE